MDLRRAKELLASLADGIDPLTGQVFPEDDSCNRVEIVRAIYTVLRALNEMPQGPKEAQAENAGKPWTQEDERLLCKMYDAGSGEEELCAQFKRTPGAIAARLVRLGKIQEQNDFQ